MAFDYARNMGKSGKPGPNARLAALSVMVLSLASSLVAKCPTYAVELRGKIECSFKSGDKVLVTLIFSDNQPEASGEETALDIHDGRFNGRVAFKTYSSSGLLGEDKCGRRPKGVLIRLIEADGVEKDRTSLKIASAFTYDEKQGEYTVRSEVILHGWCEPKCDETPQPTGEESRGSVTTPIGWHKVDAGAFSLFAPLGWEFHQLMGVDSYVGEFLGDGVVLKFDFGRYSSSLKEAKKPAYVIAHQPIGGFPAKIVSPIAQGHGVTGVYFHSVGRSNALCLWGQELTSKQQELVLKIFETIRFGGTVPQSVIPPPPTKTAQ
jgi:hypothetical protein